MSVARSSSADIVIALQAQIGNLTGRVPVSRNVKYLENRLADLRKRVTEGGNVHASSSPAIVMSVSMTSAARDATGRMADNQRINASALVRAALSEYAQRHGMADECKHFE